MRMQLVNIGIVQKEDIFHQEQREFQKNLDLNHKVGGVKHHLGVSENRGTPKSAILMGFSLINYKPSISGYPHDYGFPHFNNSRT